MDMSGDDFDRAFTIVAETRRRWSEMEKRRIVEEASGACTNASAVARRHGIKPSLLYRWKKELAGAAPSARGSVDLVPVTVTERPEDVPPPPASDTTGSTIEITLSNGRTLKVLAGVDVATLKRLLATIDA